MKTPVALEVPYIHIIVCTELLFGVGITKTKTSRIFMYALNSFHALHSCWCVCEQPRSEVKEAGAHLAFTTIKLR